MDKAVLVIGGGIGGIQASLDLGDMGAKVHLLEATPSIGGRMPQLDKTFPTNDCSICILAPKMSECARHPNITLHTNSTLLDVKEVNGGFRVKILRRPTYVDPDKCIACGVCEEKCPSRTLDEFDMELRERRAIFRYFLQSIPSHYVIDERLCRFLTKGKCRLCEKFCERGAINFDDKPKEISLEVGSIILSSGIDPFNPKELTHYGYRKLKDVVTSLEFERLLSASGPTQGHLHRPSDHKPPRKIAFIQCVGSRDARQKINYCSSVCCMYAIKEAIIAKEHLSEVEPTIFYMDMRCFGKEFDAYYERAKEEFGVRFVRSRVGKVAPSWDGGMEVFYTENGKALKERFDLIVLSVGLRPRRDLKELCEKLGIELNRFGFIETSPFHPTNTSRKGIYIAGAIASPKDIPETVMEASASAASASEDLGLPRQQGTSQEGYEKEVDVIGDRPSIGVFVCHCGINIAGTIDVEGVTNFAKTLPYVDWAEKGLFTCSQDFLNTIKQRIKEHGLNRVVVAACTPRTHEPLFRDAIRQAGLNEYLFEMANIRDQCSWVHMDKREEATTKAKDLVKMAVYKAANLAPLRRLPIQINPKALVIGGGLSGMISSLSLARQGYKVFLVEKEEELGGNLSKIYFTLEGDDPQRLLTSLVEDVEREEKIEIYKSTTIKDVSGYVGNFKTTLKTPEGEKEIEHGVIIVATGAKEHKTKSYLHEEDHRVITQLEFEKRLAKGDALKVNSVVMIQCVDSRNNERPYCSRVCCQQAICNALKLKEKNPRVEVSILYRDIRTYGFKEEYYQMARDKGVLFVRYEEDTPPEVKDDGGKLKVEVRDPLLDQPMQIEADLIVLSVPIVPSSDGKELAKMLKVPLNRDGFFLEAHMKLRPVDFATDGVFVAGLAHSPKTIQEAISQAKASAARAVTVLSREIIESEGQISRIDEGKCRGCGVCVEVCAYKAISIDEEKGVAVINEALCKGCGACVATCRCGALDIGGFSSQQIHSLITAL